MRPANEALELIRVRQASVRGHRGQPCMSLCPVPTQDEQLSVTALLQYPSDSVAHSDGDEGE